jgi:hypothetical protein
MTITLTVTGTDLNDLIQQLQGLAGPQPETAPAPELTSMPNVQPVQIGDGGASGEANGKSKATPATKPPATKKTAPKVTAASPKALTRADVREALTAHLARNDEEATAALLKLHGGVDKLSKLTEDKFQAVFEAASEAA